MTVVEAQTHVRYPDVLTEDQTLQMALGGRSLSRFGDGELRIAIGNGCSSQAGNPKIALEFRDILAGKGHKNLLVCIPNAFGPTPRTDVWAHYTQEKFTRLYRMRTYGSAFITRPDSMPHIDRPDYWDAVKKLWDGKDVVLVRGDEKSLIPARMPGASSIREVIGPRTQAYEVIDRLEEEIGSPHGPVILCLGACATALAYRLANKGVHALDLGHVGMFMKRAGAYAVALEQLASKGYRAKLAKHLIAVPEWGGGGFAHAESVSKFARVIGARFILDYGCGHGTLAQALADEFRIIEYDPAVPGKDGYPKPCDMVVATHVLEHVELGCLDHVLRHMLLIAGKGLYIVIGKPTYGAQKPQTNLWWLGKLGQAGYQVARFVEHQDGLHVWVRK